MKASQKVLGSTGAKPDKRQRSRMSSSHIFVAKIKNDYFLSVFGADPSKSVLEKVFEPLLCKEERPLDFWNVYCLGLNTSDEASTGREQVIARTKT